MRALRSEDWWSVILGFALISGAFLGVLPAVGAPGPWSSAPLEVWRGEGLSLTALAGTLFVLTSMAVWSAGFRLTAYLPGFAAVFVLALLGRTLGAQDALKSAGLGYALWALGLGLVVANTVGTPRWLSVGARSELFIKVGLVLLGAELLAGRIVALGAPGLLVAYGVTPVIIVAMWWLGTRVLVMRSKALVIIIACATSVCGVSAAVATAAAVQARKEELTLGIGLTMIFTVAMMVGMPALCRAFGLDPWVAGAWIGGTVDSTGAVVAAGAMLGEQAEQVAAVVKMIQNTMIGFIAFVVALYWVARVDPIAGIKPSARILWERFPKFVLGFLVASAVASFVFVPTLGLERTEEVTQITKGFRGWLFALAFVSIGLDSNFRRLTSHLVGGKPILLYALGQSANIVLTIFFAWLAFGGVLYPPPS